MAVTQFLARQLRKPSGLMGRLVISRLLNLGNAPLNKLTLASLELAPDDRVIEVGFGGGDLIERMVPAVARGRIAGVDFSPEMVAVRTKRFASLLRSGRVEAVRAPSAFPTAPGSSRRRAASIRSTSGPSPSWC